MNANRVTVVGDYFLASEAVLAELSKKVAIGDGIKATQTDVNDAKVANPASTLQVGDNFFAKQAEVDAGRIAVVGDQILATSADAGSRKVAIGDMIKATQADVNDAKVANPASTLQVGDNFFATQVEVDAGRVTVVGDYFLATEWDVGLPVAIGDKIRATPADRATGKAGPVEEYFAATGADAHSRKVAIGDKIDKFYIATSDVTIPAGINLAASLKAVIPSDTFDPTTVDALESVSASFAEQGADWSPAFEYKKGQIVNYNGQYYQCLQDNWNNLALDPETMSDFVVLPSDETIPRLVEGSGEIKRVSNYAWSSLEKPLGHVLKFSIEEEDTATVTLPTAGRGGTTAKAKAMVDAYGKVVGMRVLDPGRYFSGVSSKGEMLPPDFDRAEVSFPDGQSVMVDVLWYRDFTDPGTWKVSGFDFGDQVMPDGINSGPQTGDTYSFATGSKTFLEHRDENGSVVDVAYSGSTENSEFYIGHKSKISSFLEAKNEGTEELGDVVTSLVDLREALRNAKPSAYAAEVEAANQQLIALEERVVDKMGDLSAKMVRMETVKSHDEDYYMELNERVSRDLDLDLSEAIMRLMRASTSYQASLQVGAQLMNTSLLNYL
ncbi:MAG: carbohydrate-binding protein [Opitutales bacterium]